MLTGLKPLGFRRQYLDCIILKLVKGLNDCHELLKKVNFYVPPIVLSEYYTFACDTHATNYGSNIGVIRMLDNASKILKRC